MSCSISIPKQCEMLVPSHFLATISSEDSCPYCLRLSREIPAPVIPKNILLMREIDQQASPRGLILI